MEIKKITNKLNFDVEAQQCNHGSSTTEGGCHADCSKTTYTGASFLDVWEFWTKHRPTNCHSHTTYTCSWSCLL